MKHRLAKIKAYTLIEMMIGIAVSLFILSGLVAILAGFSKASTERLETLRLEHELRTAMSLMAHDIRRAGYFGALGTGLSGSSHNPYMAPELNLQIPNSSCILFAYDVDSNGILPTLGAAEGDDRFGYRLNNQVLQARAASDNSFSCNGGNWENLTNPRNVQVTDLAFTLTPSTVFLNGTNAAGGTLEIRNVTISMTARLVNDPTVQRTLTESVLVRNDFYTPP